MAAQLDCFAALGMPRKLAIDLGALERRYHEMSRKIHPDRFASSAVQVRDASIRATATLTRSYRTIRDPVARGLYWLELLGEKLGENNKRVPPELAEMSLRCRSNLPSFATPLPARTRRANWRPGSLPGAPGFKP